MGPYCCLINSVNSIIKPFESAKTKKLNRPKPTPEQRSRGLDAVILHEISLRVFLFKGKFKYVLLVNFKLLMDFN